MAPRRRRRSPPEREDPRAKEGGILAREDEGASVPGPLMLVLLYSSTLLLSFPMGE